MNFVKKYGLKYYAFLLNIIIFIGFYELTQSMEVVMLLIIVIPNLGSYLPKDN
jgi:hypothetical protein